LLTSYRKNNGKSVFIHVIRPAASVSRENERGAALETGIYLLNPDSLNNKAHKKTPPLGRGHVTVMKERSL